MKDRELLIWALTQLRLLWFINSDEEWTNSSPEIIALCQRGLDPAIVTALGGKSPKKQIETGQLIKYLQELLAMVGVKLKSRHCRDGEKKFRAYSIDRLALEAQDRVRR